MEWADMEWADMEWADMESAPTAILIIPWIWLGIVVYRCKSISGLYFPILFTIHH